MWSKYNYHPPWMGGIIHARTMDDRTPSYTLALTEQPKDAALLYIAYKPCSHCSKTRFNLNVPQLTSSLQIIITHIYISHFIDFLKKITESILKNGHFYDFWAVLARFGIFGPFFSFFWAILNIFWTLNIMGDDHGSI